MKAKGMETGYDIYFRTNISKAHKKSLTKRHRTAKVHTKRVSDTKMFSIPDEQMSEPPVVPKEERRYWH